MYPGSQPGNYPEIRPGMYPGSPFSSTVLIQRNRDLDVTTQVAPQLILSNHANQVRILICDKDDFAVVHTVDLNVSNLKKNWDSEWQELIDSLIINAIENKINLLSDYIYLKAMPLLSDSQINRYTPATNYMRIVFMANFFLR